MWQKHKLIIIFGAIFILAIIGGIAENSLNTQSPASINSTPSDTLPQPAPVPANSPSIQIQNNGTVVASGSNYQLLPISSLTNPGSFAVEGKITQVIPDSITKSNTPYYFVIQNNGDLAMIGVIVPAEDSQLFDVNIFPIGSNILAAGDIFPFSNQYGVLNYSSLIQATDISPALRQLNLPSATPFIEVNFQNLEISN